MTDPTPDVADRVVAALESEKAAILADAGWGLRLAWGAFVSVVRSRVVRHAVDEMAAKLAAVPLGELMPFLRMHAPAKVAGASAPRYALASDGMAVRLTRDGELIAAFRPGARDEAETALAALNHG